MIKNHIIKNTKTLLLIVLLIFSTKMMHSKDVKRMVKNSKIGAKVIINMADMVANPSHQIDAKILGGFGVFANMKINDQLSFQPELLLSLQGGTQHTFAPNVTDYEYITDEKITYILIPLMLQYHFNKLFVETGLQPAFRLSASYNYKAMYNGNVIINNQGSITDQTNFFDLGFNIGIGYHITDKISAGIRYSKGLLAINKSTSSTTLTNSVLSISVSYFIK